MSLMKLATAKTGRGIPSHFPRWRGEAESSDEGSLQAAVLPVGGRMRHKGSLERVLNRGLEVIRKDGNYAWNHFILAWLML